MMVRSFLEAIAIADRFDWFFCTSVNYYGRPPLYQALWLAFIDSTIQSRSRNTGRSGRKKNKIGRKRQERQKIWYNTIKRRVDTVWWDRW